MTLWNKLLYLLWKWYHILWTRDYGQIVSESPRSGKWPRIQKAFLKAHPKCAVCGCKKGLNVHHVIPFHLGGPELRWSNLITLCRDCHLLFGHLGSFHSYNKFVRVDARIWRLKLKRRP